MRFCCQIQETRLRKNIGKSVELGRSLRFFTIQRITAYHLASPRRVSNAIMSRILSAVLRQSILAGRTKVLAGALRIECIELSLTWFYGD
jgi:hypothetical protein